MCFDPLDTPEHYAERMKFRAERSGEFMQKMLNYMETRSTMSPRTSLDTALSLWREACTFGGSSAEKHYADMYLANAIDRLEK